MKASFFTRLLPVAAVAAVLAFASSARAISISFSSLPSSGQTPAAKILFPGNGTFSFSAGQNFSIGDGTAAGLKGTLGGTFNIGSITTLAGVSTAAITGTGSFVIDDGATDLVGTVDWVRIVQFGTGSTLNAQADINISFQPYAGINPDLLLLSQSGQGQISLNFTFTPAKTLANLKTHTGGTVSTTFSGTLAATVPEGGTTAALVGLTLVGLSILGFRRRA